MSRSKSLLIILGLLLIAALGLLTYFPGVLRSRQETADHLVQRTMKRWKIPGFAVAVVHEDRVVYLKGFGLQEAGKSAAVTPDTLFPIASCTKSFTTLAMGMLVDDGKMNWDDSVRKHLPYFHLADPLADAEASLRDLVTHRTGVGTHDLLWYHNRWSIEQRVQRASKLEQARPFRSGFQYQVVLFSAAGLAVGAASGSPWQDFVQHRVLDPLDMKSSRCTFPQDHPPLDLASPHRIGPGGAAAVMPRYPLGDPDPAGSLHSTARDLTQYLRFQLGDGSWDGNQLVSAASLAEPQTAQVVLPLHGAAQTMNPETLFLHYGMGWVVQDYRGKRMVMHGGSIDGFRAHLTLVPDAKLGIALLHNLNCELANLALSNSLVDLFLGLPTKDWGAYYLELIEQNEQHERAHAKALRDNRDQGPPRSLPSYAGVYEDSAYGTCQVETKGGQLYWVWGNDHIPLEHYRGDTFLTTYGPLVDAEFVFSADAAGTVQSFRAFAREFKRK